MDKIYVYTRHNSLEETAKKLTFKILHFCHLDTCLVYHKFLIAGRFPESMYSIPNDIAQLKKELEELRR